MPRYKLNPEERAAEQERTDNGITLCFCCFDKGIRHDKVIAIFAILQ